MIKRQAPSHAASAIMPDYGKPVVAQVLHHLDAIQRHGAFGIVGVVFAVRRLGGIAVASEIAHDERKILGEIGRNKPPCD